MLVRPVMWLSLSPVVAIWQRTTPTWRNQRWVRMCRYIMASKAKDVQSGNWGTLPPLHNNHSNYTAPLALVQERWQEGIPPAWTGRGKGTLPLYISSHLCHFSEPLFVQLYVVPFWIKVNSLPLPAKLILNTYEATLYI